MMISEIANSLFLTYLASEYLVSASPSPQPASPSRLNRTIQRADSSSNTHNKVVVGRDENNYVVLGCLAVLVGLANLFDHHFYLSLAWDFARTTIVPKALPIFSRIPSYYLVIPAKLALAATSYVLALYIDVHRDRTSGKHRGKTTSQRPKQKRLPFRSVFLPKVGWAFLRILPAYPFLAVLISFVFMFVVDLWEFVFHLPLEWLNKPIYYGTLYGPFAYTYVYVKRDILRRNHYEWTKNYSYDDDRQHHNGSSSSNNKPASASEFV